MEIFLAILKNWWWFFFPLVLYPVFKYFYFWWMRWEVYYKKAFKWIVLEIKPPAEIKKPFSAMESVFSALWGIVDSGNWRERWCLGALPLGYGGWFSFEICSLGGEIHFFLRIPHFFKDSAESAIYSQYPEAEIFEVEDYTKKVPFDIPNEKWEMYAEEYTLAKDDHFPIKTYSMFWERPAEEKRVLEEKRMDPMDVLLEFFSKILPGEQVWFQIICNPVFESLFPWQGKAKRECEKLSKRYSPSRKKTLVETLVEALLPLPSTPKASKPPELVAPELRMTPIEKEILEAIENKMKRQIFDCVLRQVYVCKKDAPHERGHYRLLRGYIMGQFNTDHLNRFTYFGGTRSRIHYWLKARRTYLRKRRLFRDYLRRFPSYFPWNFIGVPPFFIRLFRYRTAPGIRATCLLSTEELATIFHFPAKITLPSVPRVEVKKVGPPPMLSQ